MWVFDRLIDFLILSLSMLFWTGMVLAGGVIVLVLLALAVGLALRDGMGYPEA